MFGQSQHFASLTTDALSWLPGIAFGLLLLAVTGQSLSRRGRFQAWRYELKRTPDRSRGAVHGHTRDCVPGYSRPRQRPLRGNERVERPTECPWLDGLAGRRAGRGAAASVLVVVAVVSVPVAGFRRRR